MSDSGAATASAARFCRASGLHRALDGTWTTDHGEPVTDPAAVARLRRLAIPPAWRDVWAAPDPEARVQATGIDARGRTQYRYSESASADSARHKFDAVLEFGSSLPQLRAHVARVLGGDADGGTADRVRRATAAVVRLIDKGLFRVGSDRYARDNHTYGLTTLTRRHVAVSGSAIEFTFTGKEHRPWHVIVDDGEASVLVAELLAEPGDAGSPVFAVPGGRSGDERHEVTSAVVNAFIHGATTAPATAKTFRTWGGTAAAAVVTAGASSSVSSRARRVDLVALDVAADLLGNTREVARRSYVHPLALDAARSPGVLAAVREASRTAGTSDVHTLLHVDAVVIALAAELKRLAAVDVEPLGRS